MGLRDTYFFTRSKKLAMLSNWIWTIYTLPAQKGWEERKTGMHIHKNIEKVKESMRKRVESGSKCCFIPITHLIFFIDKADCLSSSILRTFTDHGTHACAYRSNSYEFSPHFQKSFFGALLKCSEEYWQMTEPMDQVSTYDIPVQTNALPIYIC